MESLIISKVNETFLRIECEPSIERELSEHFCFFVPGYKFMPAYHSSLGSIGNVEDDFSGLS